MEHINFGAEPSKTSVEDIYAHQLLDMAVQPANDFLVTFDYPHYNQKTIGCCTAIDLIDMMQKAFGKVFSTRFQYVGQKRIIDMNTIEGSSILSACQWGRKYGFLPIEFDPDGNNVDMTHAEFINKVYTPEQYAEASKYKLSAYALVALDPLNFAIALQRSQYGLMTRMSVGDNFYRPSWRKSDLEPLKAPNPITGGHSIKVIGHQGLDINQIRTMRNTWGDKNNPTVTGSSNIWSDDGDLKYEYKTQQPYVTEAYIVFTEPVKFSHQFKIPIHKGDNSPEVTALQRVLIQLGFLTMPQGVAYGFYGNLTVQAVKKFQQSKGITSGDGTVVGPLTIHALNNI